VSVNLSDVVAKRVCVEGRVQGVWFRGWVVEQARENGLVGWVRNRRDGTVEAHFEGPAGAVEHLVSACGDGPPAARVNRVDVVAAAPEGLANFRQHPTA